MRSFQVLIEKLEAWEKTQFAEGRRFDGSICDGSDEFARLAALFNRMAEYIVIQDKLIRRQEELRRELLLNVSHELRTPLTSMQGYLETLLRKSEQLSAAERRQYLDVAVRQSRRTGKLVQGIFELAKLDAEETQPNFESFCVQELLQDVVQKFLLAAKQQQIRIICDFLPEIPAVNADIGMIERVLCFLIDNAVCHAPKEGMVRIGLEYDAGQVWVTVWNCGVEIADTYLSALSECESLLCDKLNDNKISLGLLIAKRIIELHAGAIKISRGWQNGTAIQVTLPAVRRE